MDIDFFILGSMKSGTTSLYSYLNQHPDICLSLPKEPFFFEAEYHKGIDYYESQYFDHCKESNVIGEASAPKLFLPYVPERLYQNYPDAKLIIMLRNPIDRAYSQWWDYYSKRWEPFNFAKALVLDKQRIERGIGFEGAKGERRWKNAFYHLFKYSSGKLKYRTYLDVGYYDIQIKRYMDFYDKDNFLFILLDDLKNQTQKVLESIFEFLSVSNSSLNIDTTPKNVKRKGRLNWFFYKILNSKFIEYYQKLNLKIPKTIAKFLYDELNRPEMNINTKKWLIEHYEKTIQNTGLIIDRDLNMWLN